MYEQAEEQHEIKHGIMVLFLHSDYLGGPERVTGHLW